MTEKELAMFSEGYRTGVRIMSRTLDDVLRKNFIVPKWIWITFLVVSTLESATLGWHLISEM